MSERVVWEVLPDEDVAGEETVSAEELTEVLIEGFAALRAYEQGDRSLRRTEVDEDGTRQVWETTESAMKATYDQSIDALCIRWSAAKVEESDEVAPGVILDYDSQGNVVAIELLSASKQSVLLPLLQSLQSSGAEVASTA